MATTGRGMIDRWLANVSMEGVEAHDAGGMIELSCGCLQSFIDHYEINSLIWICDRFRSEERSNPPGEQ